MFKYSIAAVVLSLSLAGCGAAPVEPTPVVPAPDKPEVVQPTTPTTPEVVTPTTPEPPAIAAMVTAADLAKHKTASDCWVSYKGSVYDITSFLPKHKGGAIIVPFCGTSTNFESAAIDKHGAEKIGSSLPVVGVFKGTLK